MPLTWFQTLALGLSGVTALAVGAAIALVPHVFYASYGISLGPDPNLLSELRAPGAGLAGLGALMLLGLRNAAMRPTAIAAALIVYLGFPTGRILSLGMDGMPSAEILAALIIELFLASLLLVAFQMRIGLRIAAQPARTHSQ